MNDEVNKRLIKSQRKTKFTQDAGWEEGYEGSLYFWRNTKLKKGMAGEIRSDAIYYWAEGEGMTDNPRPYRSPIYRTNEPRKQPKHTYNDFRNKKNAKKENI